jgi:hypothetical protein
VELITGAAITGGQLFQHRLITDIVGDIYGKSHAENKLIEFSDLRGRNFQKLPVLFNYAWDINWICQGKGGLKGLKYDGV